MKILNNILAFFLVVVITSAQGDIYQWKDKKGKISYGDFPNKNDDAIKLNVKSKPSSKANIKSNEERLEDQKKLLRAYEEERQQKNADAAKQKSEKAELVKKCTKLKKQLVKYENSRYLYNLDKNGERIVFSEVEKETAIHKLKTQLSKHCRGIKSHP